MSLWNIQKTITPQISERDKSAKRKSNLNKSSDDGPTTTAAAPSALATTNQESKYAAYTHMFMLISDLISLIC